VLGEGLAQGVEDRGDLLGDRRPGLGLPAAQRRVQPLGVVLDAYAVRELYDELGVPEGRVLDLMASWVSHLSRRPDGGLVVLGLNRAELAANTLAERRVLHDLNDDTHLPFPDGAFDSVTCCVSVDYLVRPVAVFREVARVLRPGGLVVVTFSNRCFPTKAIRGWLESDDEGHVEIVRQYLEDAAGFGAASAQLRTESSSFGDPLYAVWARTVRTR
jgi:SAM-dependent methyltransferase